MADPKNASFSKSVSKHAGRAKERFLQNLGRADKTKDEIFELHDYNFNKQHASAVKLQKEFKNYVQCIKAMQLASKSLMETLSEVYEQEWIGHEQVPSKAQTLDLLWDDYHRKINDQIMMPLNGYLTQFADMRYRISKRGRKLVDYDKCRHTVESLRNSAKKKDDVKLTKAREELENSKQLYEVINTELHDELPALYERRIPFVVQNLSTLFSAELVFHGENAKVFSTLHDTVQQLARETGHPINQNYAYKPANINNHVGDSISNSRLGSSTSVYRSPSQKRIHDSRQQLSSFTNKTSSAQTSGYVSPYNFRSGSTSYRSTVGGGRVRPRESSEPPRFRRRQNDSSPDRVMLNSGASYAQVRRFSFENQTGDALRQTCMSACELNSVSSLANRPVELYLVVRKNDGVGSMTKLPPMHAGPTFNQNAESVIRPQQGHTTGGDMCVTMHNHYKHLDEQRSKHSGVSGHDTRPYEEIDFRRKTEAQNASDAANRSGEMTSASPVRSDPSSGEDAGRLLNHIDCNQKPADSSNLESGHDQHNINFNKDFSRPVESGHDEHNIGVNKDSGRPGEERLSRFEQYRQERLNSNMEEAVKCTYQAHSQTSQSPSVVNSSSSVAGGLLVKAGLIRQDIGVQTEDDLLKSAIDAVSLDKSLQTVKAKKDAMDVCCGHESRMKCLWIGREEREFLSQLSWLCMKCAVKNPSATADMLNPNAQMCLWFSQVARVRANYTQFKYSIMANTGSSAEPQGARLENASPAVTRSPAIATTPVTTNGMTATPRGERMNGDRDDVYDIPAGATTTDLPSGVLYRVRATYRYTAEDMDEISFEAGEIIRVVEYDDPEEQEEGWLMGIKESTGDKGLFPANFTRPI